MLPEDVDMKWGRGQIASALALLLGLVGLCGTLCFRYPWIFTSEEVRKVYDTQLLRSVLFVVLLGAYFAGVIGLTLCPRKRVAVLGLLTALCATLLGGARVVVPSYESSGMSMGLGWFAVSLLFSVMLLIPIEKGLALNKDQKILRKGWRTDLMYFFVSHLGIQFFFLLTTAFSEGLFGWAVNESLQSSVRAIPVWAQFGLATLLADLAQYAGHRLHHKVPWLWNFHAIHHSSEQMDWLAGSRTHVMEVITTRCLVLLPLYLMGFSEAALSAYVTLVGVQAVMIHANMGIEFGWLRYVIATPQFHHWHHAKHPDYVDANYAVHLPVIDMVFGTYRCPPNEWPEEYGVVEGAPPPGFWRQLLHPFRPKSDGR